MILACRNEQKGEAAVQKIKALHPNSLVKFMQVCLTNVLESCCNSQNKQNFLILLKGGHILAMGRFLSDLPCCDIKKTLFVEGIILVLRYWFFRVAHDIDILVNNRLIQKKN